MDRASACSVVLAQCSPGFDSRNIKMFLPSRVWGGRKEMEPIMIKLHDLAFPSRCKKSCKVNVDWVLGEGTKNSIINSCLLFIEVIWFDLSKFPGSRRQRLQLVGVVVVQQLQKGLDAQWPGQFQLSLALLLGRGGAAIMLGLWPKVVSDSIPATNHFVFPRAYHSN